MTDVDISEMEMNLFAHELHEKENHKITYFLTVPSFTIRFIFTQTLVFDKVWKPLRKVSWLNIG